jgi:signal transduction histidine kinase
MAEQELKEAYDELEKRVEEGTAELVETKETLGREIEERKGAEKKLQERNSQLHLLNQSGQALNSSLDLDRVLASLLEEVRRFMDVAGSSIWLKDTITREIVCRQAAGLQKDAVRGWRMPKGEGIAGWVSSNGKGLIVQDTRMDDRHFKGVDKEIGHEIRSILSVPIRGKEGPIGALQMVDTGIGRFDETQLEIMESLASTSAIAIENARLYRQAQDEIYERKKAEGALRKAHDELEWRVEERTAELVKVNEQLKIKIEERKRAEKKLRLVSSSLLSVQERERKRISLELHDEVGQSLVVFKLQLRSMQKKLEEEQTELRSDCQAMLDYIARLIENIRRICKDLTPGILDDLGLTAGIRWLAENVLESHDIDTSLHIANIDNLLSNEQQLLVFRIFQETFTNIVRHSLASHASIVIKKQGEEISFVIEDDGKGFDLQEPMSRDFTKRGLGLDAMEERARMLGGRVTIWSQRDLGTKIDFRVSTE